MVQLPATAAIEYVAACCITRTRTITKTKTKTKTETRTKIRTRTKTITKTKTGTITKIVPGCLCPFPPSSADFNIARRVATHSVAWRRLEHPLLPPGAGAAGRRHHQTPATCIKGRATVAMHSPWSSTFSVRRSLRPTLYIYMPTVRGVAKGCGLHRTGCYLLGAAKEFLPLSRLARDLQSLHRRVWSPKNSLNYTMPKSMDENEKKIITLPVGHNNKRKF